MQFVSRDVNRLLSQFRVIFQIMALERSGILDCLRSLHCLPLVVLRHVTAQASPARFTDATYRQRYNCISRDEGLITCAVEIDCGTTPLALMDSLYYP
jgi:hypothetical protein